MEAAPFTCLRAASSLSVALAETVTEVPDTVEPFTGAVMETVGAVVPACAVIIELSFLEGRKKLTPPVETLLQYDS